MSKGYERQFGSNAYLYLLHCSKRRKKINNEVGKATYGGSKFLAEKDIENPFTVFHIPNSCLYFLSHFPSSSNSINALTFVNI